MATNNKITVGVEYQLNQAKFNEIMSALTKIQEMSTAKYMSINKGLEVEEAKKQLKELTPIITKIKEDLTKSFNTNIGTVNISKFNQELTNSKLNINQVYKALQNYGTAGQIAFRNLSVGLATQNLQLKESHTLLDKMSQTMANTVRYGISSSVFNTLSNKLQQSYEFSKQLNTSLNDIRIVTDKSANDMERFAMQANKAAQALGKTTQDYAKASLIYFQQGLSDEETEARTRVTLKAANVTGQQPSEVSEQLTAVWNGYKVSAAETELYMDKLAAVAAGTAADLEELSTGMSKVASAANLMGVDIDQLNAQLATIVSVTRQAPESIGTALKTIYGRMSDIQAGVDEEVSLGNYTTKMAVMGVNVLDTEGKLRDMGEVIDEIGNKWDTMSREQQVALSKIMGGTRQYNNLLALFDNWDMYLDTIKMSKEATGTLQKQQDIYMESTEAHLQQLQAAWEKLFITIFDAKGLNGILDGLTKLVGLFGDFTQAIGGGGKALTTFGAIGMQVMNKQMTQGIATSIGNFRAGQENKKIISEEQAYIDSLGEFLQQQGDKDQVLAKAHDDIKKLTEAYQYLTAEEINEYKQNIATKVELENENAIWEDKKQKILDYVNTIMGFDDNVKFSFDDLLKEDNFDKMTTALSSIDDQFDNLDEAIKIFEEHQEDVDIDAQQLAKDYENIVNIMKELQDKGIDVFAGMKPDAKANLEKRFEKQSKDYVNVMKSAKGKALANDVSQGLKTGIKSGRQDINDASSVIDKNAEHMDKMANKTREANAVLEEQRTKLQNLNTAETITKVTTGMTQLISAWNTLSNLPSILNNDDLSTGEKFLQIIMALTSGIGMAVSGFNNLSKAKDGLIEIKDTFVAFVKAKAEQVTANAAAAASETTLAAAETTQGGAAAAAGTAGMAAGAGAAATGAGAAGATPAVVTFGAALWTAVAPVLPIILGVGAAIAAVTAVVYVGVKAWNKEADAAKEAAENLEFVTENYNRAKEASDALNQSMQEYQEGIKVIDDLRVGTIEYTKAIEKANEKTKELIETYKLYGKYGYSAEHAGLLTIDEGVLEEEVRKAKIAEQYAQKQKINATIGAKQTALESKITNTGRAFSGATWGDFGAMSLMGFIPGVGQIGQGMYAGKRAADMILSKGQTQNIINTLLAKKNSPILADQDEYTKAMSSQANFTAWIKATYAGNDAMLQFKNTIGEQISSFKTLIASTEELERVQKDSAKESNKIDLEARYGNRIATLATDKNGNLNSGLYEEYLDIINNSQTAKQIEDIKSKNRTQFNSAKAYQNHWWDSGSTYDKLSTWQDEHWFSDKNRDVTNILKNVQGINDEWLVNKIGTSDIGSDEELARAWAKLNNIDIDSLELKDKQYLDKNGKAIIDISSDKERGKIRYNMEQTLENMAKDATVDETYSTNTEAVIAMLENIQQQATEGGKRFGTSFSSSLMAYFQGQGKSDINLSGLAGELSPDEIQIIQKMTPEEIGEMLGLTPENLAELGAQNLQDFATSFKQAAEDIPWDIDKAIEKEFANVEDTLPEGLSKKKLSEHSEEIKEYAKFLTEIANGAEEAADGNDDLANSLQYDAKSAILVSNSIIRMNSGIDKLADSQAEWLSILKKSNISSQEYYDALKNIRDAFGDLLDLSENTEEYLDGDFFTENAKLIEQAATGSAEAIEKLREVASKEVLLQIAIDNGLAENEAKTFANWLTNEYLKDIESKIPSFKIGADFDYDGLDESEEEFINKCQEMVNAANMTADQAKSFFETMGFETEFETETKPIVKQGRGTRTVTTLEDPMEVAMPDGSTMTVPGGWETKTYPGEPYEYVDYIDAIAMTTDGKHPKIKSFTKKGSGSMNNYSSSNSAGKAPGKSSGGGSNKKNKREEHEDKEADIYHEIDNQIKIVTTDLQRLQKVQDKLFGSDAIENLNKQYALLTKQAENYTKKISIAEDEYTKLRAELEAAGINFTADGMVANYVQTMDAILKEYNDKVDEYNNLSASEKEKWDENNTLKDAKEAMEKKREKVDRVDTLRADFIPGLYDERSDILREQIAIKIKNFNAEIQLRLDMKEALKDWDSFRKEVLDDWDELWKTESFSEGFYDAEDKWHSNLLRTAKEDFDLLRGYFDKVFTSEVDGSTIYGSGLVGAQTEHLNELIGEAKKAFENNPNGLFADETGTALENLKEYKEEAMTTAREIKQKIEDIKSLYLNTLKEASDKFKEQTDMLSRVSKLLEHDAKLIKMIYGDDQYEALTNFYQKQHDNNIQQLDFSKKQVDFWKNQMNMAKENSDEWKYAKEQWLAAIDDASSKLEQAVETAKAKWENAIDNVFDKMDKKFTDGLGLDYIKEEWNLINKNADQYLDSINSAYGIQKLQNKYQDAIDKSTDVHNQRRLNDLMNSEVEYLQQIDRLTQTDLDRAELKYQIALKQMELEDAQNAKTTMRLRRDSQGNYSYQFVANQDNINKAKEELEMLKNQLYNFDLEAYRKNLDQAATAYEEYMSKMAEAAKIVDPEERAAKEKLIQEEYQEYVNMLTDENERYRNNLIESAIDEKIELNQLEKEDFINATDEKIDKVMNDLVPQWDSGIQSMIDKWSGSDGFKETTEAAIDELMDKDEEYRKDIDEIQKTADVDFGLIKRSMNDTRVEALEPYIQKNDELVNAYETQVKYIRNTLIPQLKDLEDQYWALVAAIQKANDLQGIEYEKEADKAGRERQQIYDELNSNIDNATALLEDSSGNSSSGQGEDVSYGNKGVTAGQVITGFTGKYFYDSYGTDPAGVRKSGKAVKVDTFSSIDYGGTQKTGSYAIHISDAETGAHLGWVKPEDLEGFSTGGYTGTWGSDGRLAFLHQKELVLNETDTSNFLNALDIMRNIVSNIGSDAFARLAGIGGNRIGDPAFAGIEQNVVINADFPNATDHNEIQQAFDNLMNIASQRINRK